MLWHNMWKWANAENYWNTSFVGKERMIQRWKSRFPCAFIINGRVNRWNAFCNIVIINIQSSLSSVDRSVPPRNVRMERVSIQRDCACAHLAKFRFHLFLTLFRFGCYSLFDHFALRYRSIFVLRRDSVLPTSKNLSCTCKMPKRIPNELHCANAPADGCVPLSLSFFSFLLRTTTNCIWLINCILVRNFVMGQIVWYGESNCENDFAYCHRILDKIRYHYEWQSIWGDLFVNTETVMIWRISFRQVLFWRDQQQHLLLECVVHIGFMIYPIFMFSLPCFGMTKLRS